MVEGMSAVTEIDGEIYRKIDGSEVIGAEITTVEG
jgi:hypothetical protein